MRFYGSLRTEKNRTGIKRTKESVQSFGWFFISSIANRKASNLEKFFPEKLNLQSFVGSNTYVAYLEQQQYEKLSKNNEIELFPKNEFFEITAKYDKSKEYIITATKDWGNQHLKHCEPFGSDYFLCKNLTRYDFNSYSNDPHVYDIETMPEAHKLNRYSVGYVQSGDDSMKYEGLKLWNKRTVNSKGLTGKDIVVTVIDTGVDVDNIFFYDPQHPITPNVINNDHRKIIEYQSVCDSSDTENGHGTHVSGTILGKSYIEDSTASLYNGVAPDAKLHIVDVGGTTGDFEVMPNIDVVHEQMKLVGSSVQSNSWGYNFPVSQRAVYDKLAYDNQDITYIAASGNGCKKQTVNTPGDSKNFLTVGAFTNTNSSLTMVSYDVVMSDGTNEVIVDDPFQFMNQSSNTLKDLSNVDISLSPEQGKAYVYEGNDLASVTGDFLVLIYSGQKPATKPSFPIFLCDAANLNIIKGMQRVSFYMKPKTTKKLEIDYYSSWGPTNRNIVKPEIATIGTNVYSARAKSKVGDATMDAIFAETGTSMATPNIAGIATLVTEYFKKGYYPTLSPNADNSFTPSSSLVKATIINSATMYENTVLHSKAGFGIPVISKSLGFDEFGVRFIDKKTLKSNSHVCFEVETKTVKNFSVTMSYMDYPMNYDFLGALFLNANLVVEDPNGNTYTGNDIEGGAEEEFSTNERVFIKDSPIGKYKIHIYTKKFSDDVNVAFSLAVMGGFETNDLVTNPINLVEVPNTCPKSCSSHGTCVDGMCQCDGDYYGNFCQSQMLSAKKDTPYKVVIPNRRIQWIRLKMVPDSKVSIQAVTNTYSCIRLILLEEKTFSEIDSLSTISENYGGFKTEFLTFKKGLEYMHFGFYVIDDVGINSEITLFVKEPPVKPQEESSVEEETTTDDDSSSEETSNEETTDDISSEETSNEETTTDDDSSSEETSDESSTEQEESQESSKEEATKSSVAKETSESNYVEQKNENSQEGDNDYKISFIIIAVSAAVAVIAIVLFIIFVVIIVRNRKKKETTVADDFGSDKNADNTDDSNIKFTSSDSDDESGKTFVF